MRLDAYSLLYSAAVQQRRTRIGPALTGGSRLGRSVSQSGREQDRRMPWWAGRLIRELPPLSVEAPGVARATRCQVAVTCISLILAGVIRTYGRKTTVRPAGDLTACFRARPRRVSVSRRSLRYEQYDARLRCRGRSLAGAVTSANRTDPRRARSAASPQSHLVHRVRFTNRFTEQAIDLRFPRPPRPRLALGGSRPAPMRPACGLTFGMRGSPTAFGGRGFRLLGLWPCLTEDNDGVVIASPQRRERCARLQAMNWWSEGVTWAMRVAQAKSSRFTVRAAPRRTWSAGRTVTRV